MVLRHTDSYPRTDDAEILANFIGIAPQVEGPLIRLNVHDNQFVKKGDLLFEIDDRPYRYTLERTTSDQATLEGQISDERRKIAALVSAVSVSEAYIHSTEADVEAVCRRRRSIQAKADLSAAEQARQPREGGVGLCEQQSTSELSCSSRKKQFVTVDQVDRARTSEVTQAQALKQAESQQMEAEAALKSALAQVRSAPRRCSRRARLSMSRLRMP